MSALTVKLTKSVDYTTTPAEIVTLPKGDIVINRIIDIPGDKKVIAFVDGIGRLELPTLSDANYDSPAEWSNADVVAAVKAILTS
jgi:hypothetical protein